MGDGETQKSALFLIGPPLGAPGYHIGAQGCQNVAQGARNSRFGLQNGSSNVSKDCNQKPFLRTCSLVFGRVVYYVSVQFEKCKATVFIKILLHLDAGSKLAARRQQKHTQTYIFHGAFCDHAPQSLSIRRGGDSENRSISYWDPWVSSKLAKH